METDRFQSLQEKLDRHYAWPALYMFKFIVPSNQETALRNLFPLHETSKAKASEKGNYISLTYQMMMPSSQSVIDVYRKASAIKGLVAL